MRENIMSTRTAVGRFVAAMLALGCLVPSAVAGDGPSHASEIINLRLCGVYFVPNEGQWSDRAVIYGLRTRGLDVAFRESALTMHLARQSNEASPTRERGLETLTSRTREEAVLDATTPLSSDQLTLTVTFPGSNDVEPIGAQPQTAKFNYFVGGESRNSVTNIPSFAEVVYENLYEGIDLHVTGSDHGILKYEFHVAPGADHGQIRIRYDGIDSLCVDEAGNLRIESDMGALRDGAPAVWQNSASARTDLPAHFALLDNRTHRIAIDGEVDPRQPLIIDPQIEWSTYLGGVGTDYSQGLAVDSLGNAFQTGWTNSTDFEGADNSYLGGNWDTYITKVNSGGDLQWMSYIGGSGAEFGYGIATDPTGNIFAIGVTNSTDFAGRINESFGSYDAFVFKVTPNGILQWMRHLGGAGDEQADGVAVDALGNVLITGETNSTAFDGRNNSFHGGESDAFLVEVAPLGSLTRMLYFGGSDRDGGLGVALDHDDHLLLTGLTASSDFPGRNNTNHPALDVYVIRASRTGETEWMTYLGGTNNDTGYALVAGDDRSLFISAMTESDDFEGASNPYYGGERDALAVKISPQGVFQWALHVGGTGRERGRGIVLDHEGGMYMTGGTTSPDYSGAINAHHGGEYDAWITRVTPQGTLDWMMYVGGSGDDWGRGLVLFDATRLVLGGITTSPDLEARKNAFHGELVRDSFVATIRLERHPRLTVNATCPSGGPIHISWIDATPGQQVALIFAAETGAFRVPQGNPCAGTELGLGVSRIRLAWRGSAGPDGSRTLDASTGPEACGGYLQLLDLGSCATSNVAQLN